MVTIPPSAGASNTPAENTAENAQTIRVDWVSVSFVTAINLQEVWNFIGIGELENLETIEGARYGFAGYTITYKLGHIELMHNPNEDRWLLNMSGQGCREFELKSCFDFVTLFALLTNFYASYSRLDIAIDDYDNIYNVNTIRKAVYNKQCVTRLKEWGNSERGKIATGRDELTMDNFYLGSPSSRYFINVYDKKMERANKGFEVDDKTWIRTEVRLKDEYAEQFVRHILEDTSSIGEKIFELLNDKVVFLKPTALLLDKNRSRLAKDLDNHARWWRKFLNTTRKLPLTVYKPDMPLLASKSWLLRQVSTTLASFQVYFEDDMAYEDFIRQLTVDGMEKMDKRHLNKINQQKELDEYLQADRNLNMGWYKREVKPVEEKIERMRGKKEKKKHLEQVMDVHWEQVAVQQANEQKKSTDLV